MLVLIQQACDPVASWNENCRRNPNIVPPVLAEVGAEGNSAIAFFVQSMIDPAFPFTSNARYNLPTLAASVGVGAQ
jgi:hypothetical protein